MMKGKNEDLVTGCRPDAISKLLRLISAYTFRGGHWGSVEAISYVVISIILLAHYVSLICAV